MSTLAQYKIKDSTLDIASKLKIARATSWVFVNGSTNSAEARLLVDGEERHCSGCCFSPMQRRCVASQEIHCYFHLVL